MLEFFDQTPGRVIEEVGVGEGLQLFPEALGGAGDVGVDHKLVGANEVPDGDHDSASRLTHKTP